MSMPFAIGRHLRQMVSERLYPTLLQLDRDYRLAGCVESRGDSV
jgi:hypothetical protein